MARRTSKWQHPRHHDNLHVIMTTPGDVTWQGDPWEGGGAEESTGSIQQGEELPWGDWGTLSERNSRIAFKTKKSTLPKIYGTTVKAGIKETSLTPSVPAVDAEEGLGGEIDSPGADIPGEGDGCWSWWRKLYTMYTMYRIVYNVYYLYN